MQDLINCIYNAEPIEPPPPVTSIFLLVVIFEIKFSLIMISLSSI